MTPIKLDVDLLSALGRAKSPTGPWNKYKKVVIDEDIDEVLCYYYRKFVTSDYGDMEYDGECDILTVDERYQYCGFRNKEHYEDCLLAYEDSKKGL